MKYKELLEKYQLLLSENSRLWQAAGGLPWPSRGNPGGSVS